MFRAWLKPDRTAANLVRAQILQLTYTAHDMAPFARDLGHHGPPFPGNEEERRHLRPRLDAAYTLSTFRIIQRQDQAAFNRYRTKDLILAYMNALAAGDTESVVTL